MRRLSREDAFFDWGPATMKILVAGASGYGNLGDDAYRRVFAAQLSEHELMFDSPYPDGRAVDWCDYLVIGGGGLIYDDASSHFEYMSCYLDRAIAQGKRFSFLSCGVQPQEPDYLPADEEVAGQLRRWAPYLRSAELITVRSERCRRIVARLAPEANVHYAADLVYLLEPASYHLTLPSAVVVVPTRETPQTSQWTEIRGEIRRQAGPRYVVAMSRDDYAAVETLAEELGGRFGDLVRWNLSPEEACRVIADAAHVYTGRYHGRVMAYAQGVPHTVIFPSYKNRQETPPHRPEDALRTISLWRSIARA